MSRSWFWFSSCLICISRAWFSFSIRSLIWYTVWAREINGAIDLNLKVVKMKKIKKTQQILNLPESVGKCMCCCIEGHRAAEPQPAISRLSLSYSNTKRFSAVFKSVKQSLQYYNASHIAQIFEFNLFNHQKVYDS